jgi:hypothetical protein
MIGGPVGGALVAFAGFAAASLTDSISFAVVLVALIAIRPRFAPPTAPRRNILRESADGIRVAGVIVGGQAAGAIVIALLVARRGSAPRPGLAAALGLTMIAAGELVVGLSPFRALAVGGAVVMGVGNGTFVCNLGPVLMGVPRVVTWPVSRRC